MPYGANILVKEGSAQVEVKPVEWDPYTRPIITENKDTLSLLMLMET